jgi:predicted deacetylase
MPETLPAVSKLLDRLGEYGWKHLTLLIVPGKAWCDRDIDTLHHWQCAGHTLAGHGWCHQVDTRQLSGIRNRLHSLIISRNVAEHLALDAEGILRLLGRCHRWFEAHDLTPPEYYVPPAWAMGTIKPQQLQKAPFRRFEYFTGVYDAGDGCFTYLPLLGFEADNTLRAISLRFWNKFNQCLASLRRPLRIAIHPYDTQLKQAQHLTACLERYRRS